MNETRPKREEVISSLKVLVRKPGYIYALCMILFEDFHINIYKPEEINHYERLSTKEGAFILGLLIQEKIDFTEPPSHVELMAMKAETYEVMKLLHTTFNDVFFERLVETLKQGKEAAKEPPSVNDFFGTGEMMTEPIFYSGTGVYDIQYLEFLDAKYAKDAEWLKNNKRFVTSEAADVARRIKEVLQKK